MSSPMPDVKSFHRVNKAPRVGVLVLVTPTLLVLYPTLLGKQNDKKTRNIILNFKDRETRQKIYNERKKLVINGNPKKSVYLNDSLTKHRQELLYAALQLVKQKRLYAAWSQAGNILVRKSEDSNIIQVHNHGDLMILKTDETEHVQDEDSSRQPDETSVLTHLSGYSYNWDSDI